MFTNGTVSDACLGTITIPVNGFKLREFSLLMKAPSNLFHYECALADVQNQSSTSQAMNHFWSKASSMSVCIYLMIPVNRSYFVHHSLELFEVYCTLELSS